MHLHSSHASRIVVMPMVLEFSGGGANGGSDGGADGGADCGAGICWDLKRGAELKIVSCPWWCLAVMVRAST